MRIVIAGGGVSGWTAAAVLARTLGRDHGSIRVLGDEGEDGAELALATLPSARDFHPFLGLAEDELMAAAGGSFRLGTRFGGWAGPDSAFFQPFGDTGAMLQQVGFHHHLLRLGGRRGEDFALAALAARAGRFTRPSPDPRSVLSTLDYGLHLEARPYAEVLRACAGRLGAVQVEGGIAAVERSGEGIAALVTDAGDRIEGDLFIDATGARGRLIGEALGVPMIGSGLPFDRRRDAVVGVAEAPAPNTEAMARPEGVLRTVPLQGRAGISLIYASEDTTDEAASQMLHDTGVSAPLVFGRRERAWADNCIAVGGAAGQVDPLGLASLHLLHAGLLRLTVLFPHHGEAPAARAEYNRLVGLESDRLGDFMLAHFKTNGRLGEPAWDRCREAPAPEALAHKIGLWQSRARTPMLDLETFPEAAWSALFQAQGISPRRHDPFADAMDEAQLRTVLDRMSRAMADAVQTMPSHGDFIAAHCPAARR